MKQKTEQIREILVLFYSEISAYKFQVVSKKKLIEAYKIEIKFKKVYCELLKSNISKALESMKINKSS